MCMRGACENRFNNLVVFDVMACLLMQSWQDRSEEEGLIIERILILVRNILHIPPDPDVEKCNDNGVSVHDKASERLSCVTINFITSC